MIRLGVIRAAAVALRQPEHWGQGDHSPDADRLSVLGALTLFGAEAAELEHVARVCPFDAGKKCWWCRHPRLERCCPRFHPPSSLAKWNDFRSTTHADVVDLFARAISLAEAEAEERKSA